MGYRKPARYLLVATVALCLGNAAIADGEGVFNARPGTYGKIEKLIDAGEFREAVGELDKLLADQPDDADTLNLLGFSYRKLGEFEQALDYYLRALESDPEHRGALEYLGELYLETEQPDLDEQQLEKLSRICTFCSERRDLRRAIEEYRETNG